MVRIQYSVLKKEIFAEIDFDEDGSCATYGMVWLTSDLFFEQESVVLVDAPHSLEDPALQIPRKEISAPITLMKEEYERPTSHNLPAGVRCHSTGIVTIQDLCIGNQLQSREDYIRMVACLVWAIRHEYICGLV
jgi:hypothetical protein